MKHVPRMAANRTIIVLTAKHIIQKQVTRQIDLNMTDVHIAHTIHIHTQKQHLKM